MMSLRPASVRSFPADGLERASLSKAYVGVSLSNRPEFVNDVLLPTCSWTEDRFGDFAVLIGDYLHRHNIEMLAGVGAGTAAGQAMRDGAAMSDELGRLAPTRLCHTPEIISARSLYDDSSFGERLARFRGCYERDHQFATLVQQGVDVFLRRKKKELLQSDVARAHCVEYQLEELAMFELLADMDYRVLIYPGPHLPVLIAIVRGLLLDISPALQDLTLVELTLR